MKAPLISLKSLLAAGTCLLGAPPTQAVTNACFSASQTSTLIVSNINAVTIRSGDYLFTYSADGYWSAGGGAPTGGFFSIFWPAGGAAQGLTGGPLPGTRATTTPPPPGRAAHSKSARGPLKTTPPPTRCNMTARVTPARVFPTPPRRWPAT